MASAPNSAHPTSQKSALVRWWPRLLILVLIGIVAIEYCAQHGYTTTLTALSDASDDPESTLLLSEAEELVSMRPSREVVFDGQASQTIRYSWLSLFRGDDYVLSVVASKDNPPEYIRHFSGTEDKAMMPIAPKEFRSRPPASSLGGMDTENPATERRATERRATDQPTAEQPTTEQPATDQPTAEQPTTEQPATEQPATEQPTAE